MVDGGSEEFLKEIKRELGVKGGRAGICYGNWNGNMNSNVESMKV